MIRPMTAMKTTQVVLVGADAQVRTSVETIVKRLKGARLVIAEAAIQSADPLAADLLIVCCAGPAARTDLERLLAASRRTARSTPVVVILDEHDAEMTLACLQQGAVDCLARPLNLGRLAFLVDILTVRPRMEGAAAEAPTSQGVAASSLPDASDFVYESAEMQTLLDELRLAARSDSTVLITGETGTGKTHLSRILHHHSPRRSGPFLVVNCAALSSSLIESELFGHLRGSFTGADRDYVGKLSQAGEGTLLLDEIDALPLEAQAKLLRAVEEREFFALGSEQAQRFSARLVAATNRPLEVEVAEGRFREDLYYRLNVVSFRAPALRERRQDIVKLVRRFLADRVSRFGSNVEDFAPEALAALVQYDWPGNVRELRNVVERLSVMCPGRVIELKHLPAQVGAPRRSVEGTTTGRTASPAATPPATGNQLAQARLEAEQARLLETLERNHNNRSVTAAELGISRTALYKKLKKYDLV